MKQGPPRGSKTTSTAHPVELLIRELAPERMHGLVTPGGDGESDAYEFDILSDCGLGGVNLWVTVKPKGSTEMRRQFFIDGRDLLEAVFGILDAEKEQES